MAEPETKSPDSAIWQQAIEIGKREPRDVLTYDRADVRRALHDSRELRGRPVPHRIKSILP